MRENRSSGLMRGGARRSLASCLFNPSAPPTLLNIQGMLAVPEARFLRQLGTLDPSQLLQIETAVKRWLGLG